MTRIPYRPDSGGGSSSDTPFGLQSFKRFNVSTSTLTVIISQEQVLHEHSNRRRLFRKRNQHRPVAPIREFTDYCALSKKKERIRNQQSTPTQV